MGAEIEGSFGVTGFEERQSIPFGATTVDRKEEVDVNHSAAIYAVAAVPLNPKMRLGLRGGYHWTQLKRNVTLDGVEFKDTRNLHGPAIGSFVETDITPTSSLRTDFTTRDYEDDDYAYSGSIAYVKKF